MFAGIVEIADTPASGLAGFAIKAYLAVFHGADFPERDGGAFGALDERYYGACDMRTPGVAQRRRGFVGLSNRKQQVLRSMASHLQRRGGRGALNVFTLDSYSKVNGTP